MKKIFFAAVMLVAIGVITNAQTNPSKTTTQKKETVKPASSVNSVSPASTPKSTAANSNTKAVTKTSSKPASTTAIASTENANGKHKKHHAAKKPAKKS
jgi:cytoskeletal protein RodZ